MVCPTNACQGSPPVRLHLWTLILNNTNVQQDGYQNGRRLFVCSCRRYTHAAKSFSTVHIIEPQHEISNNVVCATSKALDQPAHTRSLIRAFAWRLNILWLLNYWLNSIWVSKLKRRLHKLVWVYTCQNATFLEILCNGSYIVSKRVLNCSPLLVLLLLQICFCSVMIETSCSLCQTIIKLILLKI